MSVEKIDTLVVGGGQAGIAMSEHLGRAGIPHVVLERDRIAERWRTGRWDSLVANGPAWHDRFPNMTYDNCEPEVFPGKDRVAEYFVQYAKMINAPIRCGVEVTRAQRLKGRPGFRVETSDGVFEARRVVCATGAFQRPIIPDVIPESAPVDQIHSFDYRNPDQLKPGAVLVVGAGASGSQIAEELIAAGRKVYLSLGPHDRPPRRYRNRDFVWWLGVLGKWDLEAMAPGTEHVTVAFSGANGGNTVDFRRFAEAGCTLVGRTDSYENGTLRFADDLVENIAAGDAFYHRMLDECDAYAEANGLDLPLDPEARKIGPDPDCLTHPVESLDIAEAGITTVLWATGFARDYDWLEIDTFDDRGAPIHQRGVSREQGVYFLGLPWQSRRGSSFIWGVWHDAKHVADHIATQRAYLDFHETAQAQTEPA